MANRDEIISLLHLHKSEMVNLFGINKLGLFGSYARDEASIHSDIDIAVELLSEKKSLSNFFSLKRYLEEHFGKKVDLCIESSLKPLAKKSILKEIIYV